MRVIITYTNGSTYTIRSALILNSLKAGSNILRITTLDEGQDLENLAVSLLEKHGFSAAMAPQFVRELGELPADATRDLLREGNSTVKKIDLREVERVEFANTGEPVRVAMHVKNGLMQSIECIDKCRQRTPVFFGANI